MVHQRKGIKLPPSLAASGAVLGLPDQKHSSWLWECALSNSHQMLCWAVSNLSYEAKNQLEAILTSLQWVLHTGKLLV